MRRAALVILAGCAAGPHVPAQLQGRFPVSIENQMNAPLCQFSMTLDGSPADSWLGDTIIAPQHASKFDVKPGIYHVEATTCGTHERAAGTVDVRTMLVIGIGPRDFSTWRNWPAYVATAYVPAVSP